MELSKQQHREITNNMRSFRDLDLDLAIPLTSGNEAVNHQEGFKLHTKRGGHIQTNAILGDSEEADDKPNTKDQRLNEEFQEGDRLYKFVYSFFQSFMYD